MAQLFASAIDAFECETACLHPGLVKPLLGRSLAPAGAEDVADLFAILGDPSRTRILHLLSLADDLCVGDMALVLGMSISALSHQLRHLRERHVVSRHKAGRIVHYRLVDDHVRHLIEDAVVHASERTPC